MPQRKIDSGDGAHVVAPLLARIEQLLAQIATRDERIDELLAQVKALNARIAELEAKLGGPPKTPDNSSLPPSRGQKANAEPPAIKQQRKGRPGVARKLAEKPDATLLRRALCVRRRARRSRTGAREGVRSYRYSADQADHDAHRAVPRHLPLLQGAGDGGRTRRYARRHAVRSGYRVDDRLPA